MKKLNVPFMFMKVLACLAGVGLSLPLMAEVRFSQEMFHSGMCDASAGVALTDDLFVAADDETNTLRVYSRTKGGRPVYELPLDRFLQVDKDEPEADIEGAARVGEMIYWITSHGRNKSGKERSSRQRFFATRILSTNPPRLEASGLAYKNLLRDLAGSPELLRFNLPAASLRAPKEKGAFNIEGLCSRPDGSLLIALRNPVPDGKALLIPLLNPAELLTNSGTRARLGTPVQIDLGGNGVRDLIQRNGEYLIIAGAYDSANDFQLYRWDGKSKPALLHRWHKKELNPEAILELAGRPGEFLILSDEGAKKQDGIACKDLSEVRRQFRSIVVQTQ